MNKPVDVAAVSPITRSAIETLIAGGRDNLDAIAAVSPQMRALIDAIKVAASTAKTTIGGDSARRLLGLVTEAALQPVNPLAIKGWSVADVADALTDIAKGADPELFVSLPAQLTVQSKRGFVELKLAGNGGYDVRATAGSRSEDPDHYHIASSQRTELAAVLRIVLQQLVSVRGYDYARNFVDHVAS